MSKEERKIALRDPMLLVFLGLILLLVPTAIGLVHLYEEAQERHAYRDLPPVPSLEVLTGVVREYHSELIDPQLEVAYLATPQPRSGLLVLYEVRDSNRLVYHLAVVRHDIACNTCRDLLVGIFLTPEEDRILGIASLEPWELAVIEILFDETGFVKQNRGLPVAWAVGILMGAAVFLGTPDRAEATTCWAYPGCQEAPHYCQQACINNCGTQVTDGCVEYSQGFYMCKCII